MPSGKREAAKYHELSALAAAQPEEIRTRRQAAEQTYQSVLNRLGAAGTYENVGGTGATAGAGGTSGTSGGVFKEVAPTSAAANALDKRYSGTGPVTKFNVLDPEATTKDIENSAQFRIMSRLTAESEQLLARKGDLYDEMLKNTQLPIIEGAGAMARENAENIKRAMARGGSARREALQAVEQIRARERVNSQKVAALAQTRNAIDVWARDNARTNIEAAQNWAGNLGGIRESYNRAMDQASELMARDVIPQMFAQEKAAYEARNMAHQKQRDKLTGWVKGIMGVVSMYFGNYQGGAAMLSSALDGSSNTGGGGGGGDQSSALQSVGLGVAGAFGKIFGPGPSATPNSSNTTASGWTIKR